MTFIWHKQPVKRLLHLALNLSLFLFQKAVSDLFKERIQLNESVIFKVRLLLDLHIKAMYASIKFWNFLSECTLVQFCFFQITFALLVWRNDKFISSGTILFKVFLFGTKFFDSGESDFKVLSLTIKRSKLVVCATANERFQSVYLLIIQEFKWVLAVSGVLHCHQVFYHILFIDFCRAKRQVFKIADNLCGYITQSIERICPCGWLLQLVFNAKNIVDFHCDISGYLRQKNIDFDVFHKSFHIFGILGGTTHNVVNFSHNIVDAFVERCTLLCTLFSLLVFCFYRVEIFVKSVLFGDASIELSHEAFFLIDEFVIFSRLLFGLQTLLCPFLLNLFGSTTQLQIFLEAKHILEVVANCLCEHILFKKFARLHGIK